MTAQTVPERGEETVLVQVRVANGRDGQDPVELAASHLWAEGATALEVREDPEGATLLAGYPTADAAREVARRLEGPLDARVHPVTDTTWRDAWRQWVKPVPVGRNLVVVPSWRSVPVDAGRLRLEIDPGDCFGSGSHPSTRMLLGWMDSHPPSGADVTDVGTGSGILAVAAAKLGARAVTAVDIDAEAAAAAGTNAARNGVAQVVAASTTPAAHLPPASADLVLVNVTAGTHAAIGAGCARIVRPGGLLLVAGLLPGQWQHVAAVYRDLTEVGILALDGWEGAVLRRPEGP